jgi:hypothetical protein
MGKKLIKPVNADKINKAFVKPKLLITTSTSAARSEAMKKVPSPTSVKKTSRPSVAAGAPKKGTGNPKKVTVTGTATGTKSLTAAQVARFKKLAGNTKMGNR